MEAFLTCLPGERKERALIQHVSLSSFLRSRLDEEVGEADLAHVLLISTSRESSKSLDLLPTFLSLATTDDLSSFRFPPDGSTTAFVSLHRSLVSFERRTDAVPFPFSSHRRPHLPPGMRRVLGHPLRTSRCRVLCFLDRSLPHHHVCEYQKRNENKNKSRPPRFDLVADSFPSLFESVSAESPLPRRSRSSSTWVQQGRFREVACGVVRWD